VSLLTDRSTAAELLREAIKIEPESKEAVERFRTLGYRKIDGEWQESSSIATNSAVDQEERTNRSVQDDPLLGLTMKEVKTQLGEPKRSSRCFTQGRTLEQWFYDSPKPQYINFLSRSGLPQPTVIGRYFPR
jgi:hypothetical protein